MEHTVLNFPNISPVLFEIELGPISLALRWYALAYIFGILIGWWLINRALKATTRWPEHTPPLTKEALDDLATWLIVGVIVGGRIGYVLFYQPSYFLANPADIFKIWQGGMAFHGGFLGVVVAAAVWGRKHNAPLLQIADLLALAAPPGLMLGRIANFINAELWGKPWDGPWAVIFPGIDAQACTNVGQFCARHPSQLYEAALEGLVLGLLLIFMVWRTGALKRPGLITGIFFAGYGSARFFVEEFRQADAQFITALNPDGHVFMGLQMGQLLSLPMIFAGLALIVFSSRKSA